MVCHLSLFWNISIILLEHLAKQGNESPQKPEKADLSKDVVKPIPGNKRENDPHLPTDRPMQKNKKRCWTCRVKLELVQQEVGKCRCGKICISSHCVCVVLCPPPPSSGHCVSVVLCPPPPSSGHCVSVVLCPPLPSSGHCVSNVLCPPLPHLRICVLCCTSVAGTTQLHLQSQGKWATRSIGENGTAEEASWSFFPPA